MTLRIRRILVPIRDLQAVPSTTLRKAAALARTTGARIELFHAIEPAGSRGPENLDHAQQQLARIARSAWSRGCEVRTSVALESPPHEAIVKRAHDSKADLVLAAAHAHGRTKRLFLRNTDWELIRHSPAPLLLAKSRGLYHKPVILVAVDPFHAHAKPARLDEQLLAGAHDMARLLGGSVHVLHAYMPLPANVEGPLGEPIAWENTELERIHAKQVRAAFDRLADKAKIAPAHRHLEMGDVAGELQAAVRRLRARLVVMGAVSRSGLRRILIGSTAERVLDRLSCDVLILKPAGVKRRVRR